MQKLVDSYFATATDPLVAEHEIRSFLAKAEDELVNNLIDSAKTRKIEQDNEKNEHFQGERTLDRHIRNLEAVAENCLGETDIEVDFGNVHNDESRKDAILKARKVLRNCKLLVLRNVLPREFLDRELLPQASFYLNGLASGNVSHSGSTTNGEDMFYVQREIGRWEVLLPESLVHSTKEHLATNHNILDVLKADNLLGSGMSMMSGGINFASPGAPGQAWHDDEMFLFEDNSWETLGIAGHDIPSSAVTVSIPLLDVTPEHGPTEFCLGSSTLQGISHSGFDEDFVKRHVRDQSLTAEGSVFERFTRYGLGTCNPEFWKSPVLNKGDILMFDYQLRHRGGWNTHEKDSRAIMYMTFSRYWYKDSNFRTLREMEIEDTHALHILASTRLAVPDNWDAYKQEHEGKEPVIEVKKVGPIDPGTFKDSLFGEDKHTFAISNKDVNVPGAKLFWNEDEVGGLGPGETRALTRKVDEGDKLSLRSNGVTLHEFPAMYGGQVVFHKLMSKP